LDYAFLSGQSDAQGQHRLGLTLRPGMLMHASSPMGANANDTHPVATPEHTAVATVVQKPAPAPVATVVQAPAPAPVVTPKVEAPAPVIAMIVPAPKPEAPAPVVAAAPAPVAASKPEATSPVIATATLLAHDSDATDASAAPRASDAAVQNLRASKPVRVPRLMAMAVEPAPKAAAPRVAAPKVATVVEKSLRPAVVELAPAPMASAPAAPVAAVKPSPVPSSTQNANTHTDAPVVTIVPPAVLKPATPPPAEAPSASTKRPTSVIVRRDDTMASIAKQWGTSVAAIMMENNLVTDQAKPGAKLKLPPAEKH
jgi:LysM repeat protein